MKAAHRGGRLDGTGLNAAWPQAAFIENVLLALESFPAPVVESFH